MFEEYQGGGVNCGLGVTGADVRILFMQIILNQYVYDKFWGKNVRKKNWEHFFCEKKN